MSSYQTFPLVDEPKESRESRNKKRSAVAVIVAAFCLGAAYIFTNTGPAPANELDADATLAPTSMNRCDGDRTPAEEGYPAPGPYIVTWHVWDHAEGMGFASRAEAETCFKEYDENVRVYAVRLYDANMDVLEEHGSMVCCWDELRAWAEDFMGITAGPTATLAPTAKPVPQCQPWFPEDPYYVLIERDCDRLCRQLGLIGDDAPACNWWSPCNSSEWKTFSECQVEFPNFGPREHEKCLCGPEDGERTVACDSRGEWERGPPHVPPLQCESMDITSEESCIAHQMKRPSCESGGCVIKYQNIGGTMTCSTKWRSSFWVVCGDACAWTEGEFDSGTWLAPGRAAIIYAIMMIFF